MSRQSDLEIILPHTKEIQEVASRYGIADISQDNGIKNLTLNIALGLEIIPGRCGNDVRIGDTQIEVKTADMKLVNEFSTAHHLNPKIIEKYRRVVWIFGLCRGPHVQFVYGMPGNKLEKFFSLWEKQLSKRKHLNNPKIPMDFVVNVGKQIADFSKGVYAVETDFIHHIRGDFKTEGELKLAFEPKSVG